MSLKIRKGIAADAHLVRDLVFDLAVFEKLAHEVVAEAEDFRKAIAAGHVHVLIAEWAGEPCAFALYFFNFSTFLGKRGVYLEDLFVRETHRGKGIGKALLSHLARLAVEEGCARLDWSVLDWNAPAIAFYRSLGAVAMDEWTVYRLTGAPLAALAGEAGAT
jgi:GNAT superfamily N-acetyltransferase